MSSAATPLPPTSIIAAHQRRKRAAGSASAEAYVRIKAKIIGLELAPAAPIDENALIQELGVGRTPIREALQRLALENLVIIYPRRGMLVADLNPSDLQKVFELRLELEPFAARLAAERATPAEAAALTALFTGAEAGAAADHRALIDLDREFHTRLAQAAHNEFLEETLERLYHQVQRLWNLSLHRVAHLREAVLAHGEVAHAVLARDPDAAERLMRAHIVGFQSEVLLASHPG